MSSMLYGVGADDPLDDRSCAAVVLFSGCRARVFVPAWRITKVNPNDVLRHQ